MNLTDHPFMDTEKYPFNYASHKGRLVDTTNNVYIDYDLGSPLDFWVKSDFGAVSGTRFESYIGLQYVQWAVEKRLDGLAAAFTLETPCKPIGIVDVSKANLKEFARIHELCKQHGYNYGCNFNYA